MSSQMGERMFRIIVTLVFAAALLVTGQHSSAEARNRGGDIVKGLIIGGAAAVIINELDKEARRKQKRQRYESSPGSKPSSGSGSATASWMTRDKVAKMQLSLNLLGFNAGDADGETGRQTADAVRQFQTALGQPATGQMTREQYDLLIQQADSYATARAAPAATTAAPVETGAISPPAGTAAAAATPPPTAAPGITVTTPAASPPAQAVPPQAAPQEEPAAQPVETARAPDPAPPPQPAGPRQSSDGMFTEHDGGTIVGHVFERSATGRQVPPAACASFCLHKDQCKAYVSYKDGRCELTDDVVKLVPSASASEVAIAGVKRPPEPVPTQ